MTTEALMLRPHVNIRVTDYRGLLTDREREILQGTADVTQNYVYQIRYRVRDKIDRPATNADILAEHHPDLAAELRDAVEGALDSS